MSYLILLILYVLVRVINFFVTSVFGIISTKNISKIMIQSRLQKSTIKVDFTTFSNITHIRDQK